MSVTRVEMAAKETDFPTEQTEIIWTVERKNNGGGTGHLTVNKQGQRTITQYATSTFFENLFSFT